ncbi:MAG: SpoOM family protein [Paenibacillus sp.]|jgi:sporulation-control protein|nr:SpoOM family protein [Paenibacillus sp.]
MLEIPFQFVLPHETPISIGISPIWVRTGLDIDNAVDPSDRDDIKVQAHPHTAVVFEALEELGFHCPHHRYFFNREELKEGSSSVADQFREIFDELLR